MSTVLKSKIKVTVFIAIVIIFISPVDLKGQLESNNWVFGNGVGVNFSTGQPVAFLGSKIKTTEGCATVSNNKGDLLFYTDGVSVWNKKHELMPNGINLNGHFSATQSAIIVPMPGSKSIYYVFTMDWEANKGGFCYSIVDMSKEQGLGDITLKNQLINERCTEKLSAVKHFNNKDIWIIIHEFESDAFLSYLLTKNGLVQKPVISDTGIKYEKTIYNTIGYMKISTDKKKLAAAVNGDRTVQIFNFDDKSGIISKPLTIKFENGLNPYGVEFSSDNSLLYISLVSKGLIYQLNLNAGDEQAIQKSLCLIGRSKFDKLFGALQLGIDGKIYIAEYQSKYLSEIGYPNTIGTGCSFKFNAVFLNNNISMLGLPIFYQEYVRPKILVKPEVPPKSTKSDQTTTVYNKNTQLNKKYILNNVYFDFNKAELRSSSTEELQQLVDNMKKNVKLNIEIIGHTDSIGSLQYNNRLSLARAKAIGTYLTSKGIEESRITFSYKGSSEPIATNSTEEGRQKNRRVEFILKELKNQ